MEKQWICAKCGKLNDADMRRCSCGRFLDGASEKRAADYTKSPSANHNETIEGTPKYSNRLKTVAGIICILLAMGISKVIGRGIGRSFVENSQQQKVEKVLEEALTETAIAVNKQLPIMIDSETRLDAVLCSGKTMQYRYTLVNVRNNEVDRNELMNEILPFVTNNVCKNDKMAKMIKMGAEYNYTYFDKDGNYIGMAGITKHSCGL